MKLHVEYAVSHLLMHASPAPIFAFWISWVVMFFSPRFMALTSDTFCAPRLLLAPTAVSFLARKSVLLLPATIQDASTHTWTKNLTAMASPKCQNDFDGWSPLSCQPAKKCDGSKQNNKQKGNRNIDLKQKGKLKREAKKRNYAWKLGDVYHSSRFLTTRCY